MKKTLYFIAALTMAATPAMASKARLSALGESQVILDSDVQGIFQNPAYMHYVGDFATFEMGETATTAAAAVDTNANAEGGFISTMGDAKFGVYLGRMSEDTNSLRDSADQAGTGTFLPQENPIEVFYGAKAGDLNWGASFSYSNSDQKNGTGTADDSKQSAMGLRMGVRTDEWAAFANVGLGTSAQIGDDKIKGTAGLKIGGHYMMDSMRVYGIYQNAGAKATNPSATVLDATVSGTRIGFTNVWKNEANTAFYDVAYEMGNTVTKVGATTEVKEVTTSLPLTIGTEVVATSWMKLRGSVTQNVLLGSTKETTNGVGEADTVASDTTTAAGAGFVWGRNNLDVVLTMGTNGNVDSSNFGSSASYTYLF
jgi:hypothetical protein